MTIQFTLPHALKSLAGAAIFGFGLNTADLVSGHMADAIWFALNELAGLLFWGVVAACQAGHTQVTGIDLFFLGCPVEVLHSLGSLARFLGTAV